MLDFSTRFERLFGESRCQVDRGATLTQSKPGVFTFIGSTSQWRGCEGSTKSQERTSNLLSFHGNLWEDDEAGENMDSDTKPLLDLKLSRKDVGLPTPTLAPPTLMNPLRGVEQNMMQRPISVNVWDT